MVSISGKSDATKKGGDHDHQEEHRDQMHGIGDHGHANAIATASRPIAGLEAVVTSST